MKAIRYRRHPHLRHCPHSEMKVEYIFDTAKFLVKNNKFYFAQLFKFNSTSTIKSISNKNKSITKSKTKIKLKENSNESKISAKKIKLETITSNYKPSTISINKELLNSAEEIDSKSDLLSKILKEESQSPNKNQHVSKTKSEPKVKLKEEPSVNSKNEQALYQSDEFIDEKKINFDFSN